MANPAPHDRFDPCRAWLGIDRADLADPRRVLGLVPGETDPIVVLKAAETRLKALKGLAAGPHHAAREALILQVEQAREKVLSQIAAVGNGQAAAVAAASKTGFAMPPPPRRPAAPDSDADAEGGATVLFEDRGNSSAIEEGTASPPTLRIRPRRPVRRQGSGAIWVSLLAMLASVAAGVGFIWWQARQQELRLAARSQANRPHRDEDLAGGPQGDPGARSKPLPEDVAISSSPPPPQRQQPGKKPGASMTSKSSATVGSPAPTAVATSTPRADAAMGDEPRRTPPAALARVSVPEPMDDEPATDDAAAPTASVTDTSSETMTSEDAPSDDAPIEITSTDDMAEDTEVDAPAAETDTADDETDTAIAQALAAIRTSDFDTADALLASALEGGRSAPAKRRVSDWQTLAQYAREFAGFREKAIAEVKPGNEFDVNGKKVGVVEIDDKKFIYRFQGRNKTTPRNKIPAGIAMAIVTTWFDERPANHLFLGAYHATKPEPDLAKAKDHWERAEKGGINAEPLLRLLDDPVLEAGAKASEPTDE